MGFHTVTTPSLKRITALTEAMGNPQRALRFVHIAGTNGKGSVCAFLEAVFLAAGLRPGKFTSPNLIKPNERISVAGRDISDSDLDRLLKQTTALVPSEKEKTGEEPTQFELWTAAAFEYFKNEKCDIVILETGLGGEFDATNVIETNECSVITRIALDHCALLGNSLSEITRTKCGIIKKNRPVAALMQSGEVMDEIRLRAREAGSPLITAAVPESEGHIGINELFSYHGLSFRSGLGGLHQLENAALAIEAALLLKTEPKAIRRGIASAVHRARFEEIAEGLFFDGAHNPNGIDALVRSLERYFPGEKLCFIFACMKDKDIAPSLRALEPIAGDFIFTCVEGNSRSMPPEELRSAAAALGIRGSSADTLADAVGRARSKGLRTVICGSLYLYERADEAVTQWNK